jgi:hypothetical protein
VSGNQYLRGNYELKSSVKGEADPTPDAKLEEEFERTALQKLGGSIAFIKKSASFVWKGTKSGRTG